MSSKFASDACCCFFNIRPVVVSKKILELMKKKARDRYGRFASPSSRITPPPLCQEEASSDNSVVKMWVVAPPPPTRLEEASSDDPPPSASSGYNDECPHIKEVSLYELLLDFNYLV
jgi:hypothetical protein